MYSFQEKEAITEIAKTIARALRDKYQEKFSLGAGTGFKHLYFSLEDHVFSNLAFHVQIHSHSVRGIVRRGTRVEITNAEAPYHGSKGTIDRCTTDDWWIVRLDNGCSMAFLVGEFMPIEE